MQFSAIPYLAFRCSSLLALAGSALLLADFMVPGGFACPSGGECDHVLQSSLSRFMVVPLPLVGVIVFITLSLLPLLPIARIGWLFTSLAIGSGGVGLSLIAIQGLVLHHWCSLCLIVDLSATVVGLAAAVGDHFPAAQGSGPRWWSAGATIVAFAVPLAWGLSRPPLPVPPEIKALWIPGKVNVVEISDFQCAYCRRAQSGLHRELLGRGDRVHHVRIVVPLPGHSHARQAARAYYAAKVLGRGDAMAAALFAADDLSAEACERLAASLGLPLEGYRAALASPDVDRLIDDNSRWFVGSGLPGLPVIWVQAERLVGLPSAHSLRSTLRRSEKAIGAQETEG
jgi:uncharacterized membrane protein